MYTPEMEAAVRAAAPLNLAKAKAVGETIGMSYRSVIAKAKSIGVEYVPQPARVLKPKETTKAELVGELELSFGRSLAGLEKAPRAVLIALMAHFE